MLAGHVWGNAAIDAFAKEVHSGRVLGPYIYSVGPLTEGSLPSWQGSRIAETRDAEEAARSDKHMGYIAIEVYS